jgi:xanthine dehydrogenase FAD-binding subunit
MVVTHRPDTLEPVLQLLATEKYTLFAGGTDLMVQHPARPGIPASFDRDIIFLDGIKQLQVIESIETETGSVLNIGAGVNLNTIQHNPLVPEILRLSVAKIAAPAVRNRATLAGNICNASPAADALPALYLLNAKVILSSLEGSREVSLHDFITGPSRNALQANEVLTRVLIPTPDLPISFYHKVGTRAANALTKLSVAGLAKIEGDIIVDWRVAFGAVAPRVVRSVEIEQRLNNKPISILQEPGFIDSITHAYSELICPINDQRSSAQYRHRTSLNLLQCWLDQIG